jgi:hypothetical protein
MGERGSWCAISSGVAVALRPMSMESQCLGIRMHPANRPLEVIGQDACVSWISVQCHRELVVVMVVVMVVDLHLTRDVDDPSWRPEVEKVCVLLAERV